MTSAFDFISKYLFQCFGYLAAFFSMLYNSAMQVFLYCWYQLVAWLAHFFGYWFLLFIYCLDYLLQCVVYILNQVFQGSILGVVGLSTAAIEDNLQGIIAIAPYAKNIGYILNFEALDNAFHYYCTFLILWLVYRWFRVWVRG